MSFLSFANKSFVRLDKRGDANDEDVFVFVPERCGDDVVTLVFVTRLVVLGR